MIIPGLSTLALLFLFAQSAADPAAGRTEVTFMADDGVKLYGDIYRASDDLGAPLVLLFHQGRGNARGEYAPIVPMLLENGYHALAVDQRRGGSGPTGATK